MRTPLVAVLLAVAATASSAGDWQVRRALLPSEGSGAGEPLWEVQASEADDGDLEFRVTEPEGQLCRGLILIARRMLLPATLRGERPTLLPRIELNYTSACEAEDSSGYVGAFVITETEWDRYAEADGGFAPWAEPERGLVRAVHEDSEPDVTEPRIWTGPRYPHGVRFLYEEPIYVGIVLRGECEAAEAWTGELQVRLSEVRVPVAPGSIRRP